MYNTFKQLVIILDTRTRLLFALLLIPMTAMTVLEVVSIGLIIPVVQVLIMGQKNSYWTDILLNNLPNNNLMSPELWVTSLFAIFFIFKNIFLLAVIYFVNRIVAYKSADYAQRIYKIYLFCPLHFHFKHNSADLLLNITTGINRSLETVRLLILITLDCMLMIGAFALLVYANPYVTLGVVSVLVIVGTLFYLISSPIFRRWGEISLKIEQSLIKWINQSFAGIRDVKILQAEDFLSDLINRITSRRAYYFCLSTTSIQIPRLLIETIVVIGFLGIVLLLISNSQNPADIVSILGLFGMAALRLMPSMNRILTSASEVRRSAAFIDQIYEAFKLSANENSKHQSLKQKNDPLIPVSNIKLQEVTYTYPDAKQPALNKFNIEINKGDTIGFVGASGAGKSTLMDIILGLLEPTSGKLLINEKNAFDDIANWQRHIGFVPQQIFVIDDTIRRNIAFATADNEIDNTRINTVLKLTQLEQFVESLPNGLDTILGEHGTRLSGGQRQRIAIARALYRDPDVLVFDEATSALDNLTELEITRAIETLAGSKTILIVAHRLSTIRTCNKILFMKEGKIRAIGTYEELLVKNKEFRHLAQLGNTRTT